MKIDSLLRLYPRAWRERYGDEFAALLEERGTLNARDLVNITLAAGRERAREAGIPLLLIACAWFAADFVMWGFALGAVRPLSDIVGTVWNYPPAALSPLELLSFALGFRSMSNVIFWAVLLAYSVVPALPIVAATRRFSHHRMFAAVLGACATFLVGRLLVSGPILATFVVIGARMLFVFARRLDAGSGIPASLRA